MCIGVMAMPSLSEGLESLDDTLTESMLSPELPVGGDRGVSLNGELAAEESTPRNNLTEKKVNKKNITKQKRTNMCQIDLI